MVRAVSAAVALALVSAGSARAATEISTSDRLQDRREVAAGDRAYAVGFADGGWYANGWHITGEMGGIWAPPSKLADGVWFGVDGQWVGAATRFTSGAGYVRYDLPATGGVELSRTDFVPDGRRAALFGITLRSTTPKTVTVDADVHSELLTAYPWSSSEGHPTAADNGQDTAAVEQGTLAFHDGALTAFAGSDRTAQGIETGPGFRGPRTGLVCGADGKQMPSQCDDGPVGRGAGGRLRYAVEVGEKPTFDFGNAVTDQSTFQQTAFVLENTGVGAYLGQAGKIKTPALLGAAASILTVEARHAGAIATIINTNQLAGAQGITPNGAFDKPLSMATVLAAVKKTGFIKG